MRCRLVVRELPYEPCRVVTRALVQTRFLIGSGHGSLRPNWQIRFLKGGLSPGKARARAHQEPTKLQKLTEP